MRTKIVTAFVTTALLVASPIGVFASENDTNVIRPGIVKESVEQFKHYGMTEDEMIEKVARDIQAIDDEGLTLEQIIGEIKNSIRITREWQAKQGMKEEVPSGIVQERISYFEDKALMEAYELSRSMTRKELVQYFKEMQKAFWESLLELEY